MKSTRGPRTTIIDSPTAPDTPTTAASPNNSIPAPDVSESPPLSHSTAQKRRSRSPCRPDHPRPSPRVLQKCFWNSSIQKLPIYHCSPWDFYVQFIKLETWKDMQRTLVLCNNGTEIRLIRATLPRATGNGIRPTIFEIQHQNFIDIYGSYHFEDQEFLVSEYMPFSIEEILHHNIHLTELEIAYIIGQVLNGMRFVSSRRINPIVISERSIWISHKGNVKIDPITFPEGDEPTSANASSLGELMLRLMKETQETLKSTALGSWSAAVTSFVEATSWASLDELFEHTFLAGSSGPEILTSLCFAINLMMPRSVEPLGAFSKRFD